MANKKTTDDYNKQDQRYFPEIKSAYQYRNEPETVGGETNLQASETIQGESYTIRELLKKHSSGVMPDVNREGIYMDTDDFDSLDLSNFSRLDLQEQKEIVRANKEWVGEADKLLKEFEKNAKVSQEKKQTEKETPKKELE